MTLPFQYPSAPHVRRHGPRGYPDYSGFRDWLRDEFSFRCVYCLRREKWELVRGVFHIDHFLPVADHPAHVTDYDNLLYTCASCNLAKGARALPDPLSALTASKVRVDEDGTIHATADSETAQLIEKLGLNGDDYKSFRKLWIAIVALAQKNPAIYQQFMGYPDNLPNLRKYRPPGGNSRPEGRNQTAFARKERGELPAWY